MYNAILIWTYYLIGFKIRVGMPRILGREGVKGEHERVGMGVRFFSLMFNVLFLCFFG